MPILEISDLRVLVATLKQLIQSRTIRRTKSNTFAIGKLHRHQISLLICSLDDSFKTKLFHKGFLTADHRNKIILLPRFDLYPSVNSIDYEVCGFTKYDYANFLEFLDLRSFEKMIKNDNMLQYRKVITENIQQFLSDHKKSLELSIKSRKLDMYLFELLTREFES